MAFHSASMEAAVGSGGRPQSKSWSAHSVLSQQEQGGERTASSVWHTSTPSIISSLRIVQPPSLGEFGPSSSLDGSELHEERNGQREVLSVVLALLGGILGLGTSLAERPPTQARALRALLDPLQLISFKESDEEIVRAASDVALLLLHEATAGSATADELRKGQSSSAGNGGVSEFSGVVIAADTEEFLRSPSPAMRALGLRSIGDALKERETSRQVAHNFYFLLHRI